MVALFFKEVELVSRQLFLGHTAVSRSALPAALRPDIAHFRVAEIRLVTSQNAVRGNAQWIHKILNFGGQPVIGRLSTDAVMLPTAR
jgi:hypothetical protein